MSLYVHIVPTCGLITHFWLGFPWWLVMLRVLLNSISREISMSFLLFCRLRSQLLAVPFTTLKCYTLIRSSVSIFPFVSHVLSHWKFIAHSDTLKPFPLPFLGIVCSLIRFALLFVCGVRLKFIFIILHVWHWVFPVSFVEETFLSPSCLIDTLSRTRCIFMGFFQDFVPFHWSIQLPSCQYHIILYYSWGVHSFGIWYWTWGLNLPKQELYR